MNDGIESRSEQLLTGPWRFAIDRDGKGREQAWPVHGLPDGREVTVPHTWNVEDGTEEYRGTAWYEYRLDAPASWRGQTVRLRFEAVYRDATVWLNGREIGRHENSGYTTFVLDLTDRVLAGESNRLVVSVNNEISSQALPRGNAFDWADDGGLIRDVALIVVGEPCIDYVKITANPIFGSAESMPAAGVVTAEVALANAVPEHRRTVVSVEMEIVRGQEIVGRGQGGLAASGDKVYIDEIRLKRVDLWHFDHPHLYQARIRIRDGAETTDEVEETFGFREIVAVGPELWLNREPVRLMGVEWMPGSHPEVGMAESMDDFARNLEQIKEANCVITRFHWQQDRRLLDWCDRNGLLVQEEIPHWGQPNVPEEDTQSLARAQAEEMINRHYNHPCLYAWGMGNELDGQSALTSVYMSEFREYIRQLDPHRLVNYVSNTMGQNPMRDATRTGDLLMWNEYIGTWFQDMELHPLLRQIETDCGDKPLFITEYGLCEPAFPGGDPRRIEILREKTDAYRKYRNCAGLIFFSLNDYRTHMGEVGSGRRRARIHGVVDLYGAPKPSYAALRNEASPLVLEQVGANREGHLLCRIRCRDDIPSYTVSGYQLLAKSDASDEEHSVAVPMLTPGEKADLVVPVAAESAVEWLLNIVRPTGFSVLRESVRLSEA